MGLGRSFCWALTKDWEIVEEANVALELMRLRATEICQWLKGGGKYKEYLNVARDHCKDVRLSTMPITSLKEGPSASVSLFLALLKLYFKCKLKEKVVATGVLSLSGYVLRVVDAVTKAKGAINQGAKLVLVPSFVKNEFDAVEDYDWKGKVQFVTTIADVLKYAVEGEQVN